MLVLPRAIKVPSSRSVNAIKEINFHPEYKTSKIDLAVIQFSGAKAMTPVMQVVTGEDGLAQGSSVNSVGYGQIYKPGSTPKANSLRR